MKKAFRMFIIITAFILILILFINLVYSALPKINPNYSSARETFVWAKKQLEDKHKGSRFYIWDIKAGRADIFNDSKIELGKSDKWLVTFIKYNPTNNPHLSMVTATMTKGKLTNEGFFNVERSENTNKLLKELNLSNKRFLNWDYDSNTLFYQNQSVASQRNYQTIRAIKIDFSSDKPITTLTFSRPMTKIEKQAFAMQNSFLMEIKLTYNNKIKSVKEIPANL